MVSKPGIRFQDLNSVIDPSSAESRTAVGVCISNIDVDIANGRLSCHNVRARHCDDDDLERASFETILPRRKKWLLCNKHWARAPAGSQTWSRTLLALDDCAVGCDERHSCVQVIFDTTVWLFA
jgi:hypothetical protein